MEAPMEAVLAAMGDLSRERLEMMEAMLTADRWIWGTSIVRHTENGPERVDPATFFNFEDPPHD